VLYPTELQTQGQYTGNQITRWPDKGKLIRRTLKIDFLTVAKRRLTDLEKAEWQGAEIHTSVPADNVARRQRIFKYYFFNQKN
jgi:hypothetical protein